jgi:hypothetical protein
MVEENKSPEIMVPVSWEESLDFKRLMKWAQAELPFTSVPLRRLLRKLSSSVQRGCGKHGELCAVFIKKHAPGTGPQRVTVCKKCSRKIYRTLIATGKYDDYPDSYMLEKDQGEI